MLALATLALAWIAVGLPGFTPRGDWGKHYAILNTLVASPWPPVFSIDPAGPPVALRYYLGWYLPPALLAIIMGTQART